MKTIEQVELLIAGMELEVAKVLASTDIVVRDRAHDYRRMIRVLQCRLVVLRAGALSRSAAELTAILAR